MQEHARVLYHHAKFGWARISSAAGSAKNVEFFNCLFIRHAFECHRLCARFRRVDVGVQKRYRWIGEGLQLCTRIQLPQIAANWRHHKMSKSKKLQKLWGGGSPPEADRINRSRRNLARKRIPWVCYSAPHWALIGKRGSAQKPPKSQNLPKIVVFAHRKPETDTMNTFR